MKYIALDIGNVLVHVDFTKFLSKLSRELNISLDDALHFMNRNHKLHDLGLTLMKDELSDHLKIKSPILIDELIKSWNNCITRADYMVDLFCGIKNLQVALLSNIGLDHSSQLRSLLNNNNFFDKAVKHLSCDVGARKPTFLYYQSFLQMHPEWKGCMYVDDLQENLDVGQKFGFKPYNFSLDKLFGVKDYTASKLELEQLQKFIMEEGEDK